MSLDEIERWISRVLRAEDLQVVYRAIEATNQRVEEGRLDPDGAARIHRVCSMMVQRGWTPSERGQSPYASAIPTLPDLPRTRGQWRAQILREAEHATIVATTTPDPQERERWSQIAADSLRLYETPVEDEDPHGQRWTPHECITPGCLGLWWESTDDATRRARDGLPLPERRCNHCEGVEDA